MTIHKKDPERGKWMSYRSSKAVSGGKSNKELYLVKCTSHRIIILKRKGKHRKIPKAHMRWKVHIVGWGYSSEAQSLPGNFEVLRLIPVIEKEVSIEFRSNTKITNIWSPNQFMSNKLLHFSTSLHSPHSTFESSRKAVTLRSSALCLCLEHSKT